MIERLRLLMLIALSALSLTAYAMDDLLDPDEAFRFSARMSGNDMVEVNFRVADGYYLYRDRFIFAAQPASLLLGAPEFPQPSWHEDEFFGRTEVYRGAVTVRIPVSGKSAKKSFHLSVVSQGCADIGVCYLPSTRIAELLRIDTGANESLQP